jgi:phage host-nuclease inhibitor protein Gam
MASELKRLAEEMLAFAAYRDVVNREYAARHKRLEDAYRDAGIERQRILMSDGREMGVIVVRKGSTTVTVNDPDAAIEWCEANAPTEVFTRTKVEIREAFLAHLADEARKAGVGVWPPTGERLDWLTVTTGEPTVSATATREAKEIMRDMVDLTTIRLELGE